LDQRIKEIVKKTYINSYLNKGCHHNFCQVCCDHLIFVYKNAADKNIIGELLDFTSEKGFKAILGNVDINTINKCKAECKV
jgi:hypothetical protein